MELYIFCFFFFSKLEKKENFVVRVVAGFFGVLLSALLLAGAYTYFGNDILGRSIIYGLLFLSVIGHAKLCYENGFSIILFCGSMAYAAQNLMYKLFLIFWCLGEQYHWFDAWGANFNLWYRVVYYSFLVLACIALYYLFIRRIVSKLYSAKLDKNMLALTLFVLVITVLLCSYEDIYFAKLSVGKENYFEVYEYYVLRQTGNCFSVICCMAVLLLASKSLVEQYLLREVEYLKYSIKQGERQYEMSKDTIDMINVKIHDIKYKINTVLREQTDVSPDVIDDLRKSVRIYDSNIETGNQLLNVFITDKSLYCEQNGIQLSCMIDGKKLDFMEDGDLYCLFGNIVDNALESVMKIEKKEKRVINITVKTVNDMLMIQAENYYTGNLEFKDGIPQTTKDDPRWHGFGLQSIKMIAHKYGGELTTHAVDDIFKLTILFGNISSKKSAE